MNSMFKRTLLFSALLAGWGLGLCGGTLGMALATPWLGSVGV